MTKPIRVLQVMSILNQGGAENMVMNLYRAIDREQIQFDFIVHTNERGAFDDEAESLGAVIYHAPKYTGTNHFQYVKWWKSFLAAHPEYRILHSHIRSCASVYIPIAKKRGLKTIVHSHSTSNGSGFASLVKKVMQFPLRNQADYLFACSKEAGEWLFGKKAVKKDNFKVIYNGVDCERFHFNEQDRVLIREKYGIKDNFVVGNIGRHTLSKNPLFMLEIFSEIYKRDNNARLLQVGQGEMTEQMKQKCYDLDIEQAVIFAGVHNDVEKYYSAMDVFLFPSLWEGLPLTVVEAQTSGIPCYISSKITNEVIISELVKQLPIDQGIDIWADAILSNKTSRTDAIAKNTKSKFDVMDTARQLQKYYISMIEN